MESGVSTAGGGGLVLARRKIYPLYFVALVAIVVAVLPFGLGGLQFLGGLLLVASIGFLLTLVVWPSGITLISRLSRGVGLGLLLVFYTGFWLAKFNLLGWLVPTLLSGVLLLLPLVARRGREAIRQHIAELGRACLPSRRQLWKWAVAPSLVALFLFLLLVRYPSCPVEALDGSFFFGLAREIDVHNGFIKMYPHLDPPTGRGVDMSAQGFPLLAVVISRVLGLGLLTVCQYFPLLSFLALALSVFLIGREIGGERGALLSLFFLCTLTGLVESFYFKNFDRDGLTAALSGWVGYLLLRIFSTRTLKESLRAGILASLVYGLFALVWPGWLYLVPCMVGGVVLIYFLLPPAHPLPSVPQKRPPPPSPAKEMPNIPASIVRALAGVSVLILLSTILALPFGQANWPQLVDAVLTYLRGKSHESFAFGHLSSSFEDFYLYGSSSHVYLVFLLLLSGVVYVYCFRREILPVIMAWLILLLALVWPGSGFQRFYLLWAPLLPPLESAGILLWIRKSSKSARSLSILVASAIILLLLSNALLYSSPVEAWRVEDVTEAAEWISKNSSENALFAGHWELGYLIAGYCGRGSLADPVSWMVPYTEEWSETDPPPPRIGRYIEGQGYPMCGFIPWRGYPLSGRVMDWVGWYYLDENELDNLLRYYMNRGIRIDYLYCYDDYSPAHSVATIREGDILEWVEPSGTGNVQKLCFERDNIEVYLGEASVAARGSRGEYAVVVAQALEGGKLLPLRSWLPQSAEGTILLVRGEGGRLEKAALVRPHPSLGDLLSLGGRPRENSSLPRFLSPVFSSSRGWVRIFQVLPEFL
jgi:hypothetical protein